MSDLGNKDVMAKNIQYYMDLHGKTRNDMCEALGVKYTTFTDWVKGNVYPRIDKIELMSNYFGISKADLVEENGPSNQKKREQEEKMLSYYNKLNLQGKNKVVEYASDLSQNPFYVEEPLLLNAARPRTDIEPTEEMKQHDDDIMNDENF